MNKQNEKKQLDKLWKKMQKRFTGFRNTGHVEHLHQFLISVKKIFKSDSVLRDVALHHKQAEEYGIHLNGQNQQEEDAQQKERNNFSGKTKSICVQ